MTTGCLPVYRVYADASVIPIHHFRNNTEENISGGAAIFILDTGCTETTVKSDCRAIYKEKLLHTTNDIEFLNCVYCLSHLMHSKDYDPTLAIRLYNDNLTAIQHLNAVINGDHTLPIVLEMTKRFPSVCEKLQTLDIKVEWVKGHGGTVGYFKEVDELAHSITQKYLNTIISINRSQRAKTKTQHTKSTSVSVDAKNKAQEIITRKYKLRQGELNDALSEFQTRHNLSGIQLWARLNVESYQEELLSIFARIRENSKPKHNVKL
jgi:ribonuclease HI